MTSHVDRNLLTGLAISLALAAVLALAVLRLPPRPFHASPPAPPEPRASSAWAEPRDIDWRPRAAHAAPQPADSAPPAAASAKTRPQARARAAVGGIAVAAGPTGAVAVPAASGAAGAAVPAEVAAVGADGQGAGASAAGAGAGAGDAVYGLGDVDVPPQPLTPLDAPFPPNAQRLGLSAQVLLTLVLDVEGRVAHVDARCTGCDPSFLRAARDAARTWRFAPARLHGQTVRVRVEKPLVFELDE